MSDSRVIRRPAGASRPVLRSAPLALVVALVAAGAIAITGATPAVASDELASPPGAVESPALEGASLPWYDPSSADPAIGAPMPSLEGVDFEGSPVLVTADGRAKLLLFLAHWCPHCQREVPMVQDWVDAGNLPDEVELVSIATAIDDTLPNYPPDAWLEGEGWSASVIVDATGEIADRFGLSAFPFWVMIDDEGRVAGRMAGVLEPAHLDELSSALAVVGAGPETGAE